MTTTLPPTARARATNQPAGPLPQPRELFELLDRAWQCVTLSELRALGRARQRLSALGLSPAASLVPIRVAIASDATTTYLNEGLSLLLEARGIAAATFEVPFGSVEAELLRDDSALARFRPQLLLLMQSPLAIRDWPPDTTSEDKAREFADERAGHMLALCRVAHERFSCDVVLDNLHILPERPHGSLARRMPGERNAIIRRINTVLESSAPPFVHLHDVDGVAALYGVSRWIDWRLWYHAKQPMSFSGATQYLNSLASTTAAIYRPGVKCIVVDLDNTLWGGVVGDDGLAGIRIRHGDAPGEAFQAFQRHLRRLRERGVLLAVCSKNELATAQKPFRELTDMVLSLDDFVTFKANWEPKPNNIEAIARELNLGLDALAFVDDNPVERDLVRRALPAVRVVDLPDDPAAYAAALDATGWFAITTLSNEDAARTDQYRANAIRMELATTIEDYDAYLVSLDQRAQIREFSPDQIDRVVQLINKTNQFNLLTRRVSRSDVEQMAGQPTMLTATVRLVDRFGDNGIIAIWYGSVLEDRLRIDQWLMSCRVFNRGVEQLLMNHVVALAGQAGVREIIGEFRPTEKNVIVRDLYPRLGFMRAAAPDGSSEGAEFWTLAVTEYRALDHRISLSD